jgi:membrane protein
VARVTSAIQNVQQNSGAAGVLFVVGIAGALWSASGYVAAFMRASNAIIGTTAVSVWDIVKRPVILVVVMTMFAILYWAAPNVKHPRFRWISPGGILGVILWIAASAGFAFYVANFASYNKTYGALGGVIVFLVWLWVSNIAILLGAEFNAELERGRQIEAGQPADREPILPPRDTRKLKSHAA